MIPKKTTGFCRLKFHWSCNTTWWCSSGIQKLWNQWLQTNLRCALSP